VKNGTRCSISFAQFIGAMPAYLQSRCSFANHSLIPRSITRLLCWHAGVIVAFIAEFVIAFVLMSVCSGLATHHIARYTDYLPAHWSPRSSRWKPVIRMSMHPARTFGSAFVRPPLTGLWIYFTAPVLAMQFARSFTCDRNAQFTARNTPSQPTSVAFSIAVFLSFWSESRQ